MRLIRGAALGVTTLAVLAAVTGCGSNDSGDKSDSTKTKTKSDKLADTWQKRSPAQAIAAVARKTEEAKSAKVSMTMKVPGAEGGEMTMNGVMAWDPLAMDITMKGSMLAVDPSMPDQMQMIMHNEVMYMNMGEEMAAQLDGKHWMKFDLKAMAEESGDTAALEQMTAGTDNMNQNPAQQTALLLDSPNIKLVGHESIGGVPTQHYQGLLTMEEALNAPNNDYLTAEEREEMLKGMKELGAEGFDIDVWINQQDYPVKIDMGMDTPEGQMDISATYTDYGTKVSVTPPPAADTMDLMEMLRGAGLE